MRYVFFGTPEVAKETLERLTAAGLRPAAVVTNPDAPQGRGQVMTPSPVKAYAALLGIPVLTPERFDERSAREIGAIGAEFAIAVAYGKILPESLINSFPKGVLNIHYSLLPRWRGASPVESALLHGDDSTGVTIQKMTKQLDAGDIVASSVVPILPEDTAVSLRPRLIALGADLLIETLPRYLDGTLVLSPQDGSLATRAPKFSKADGEISLDDDALSNWRKYRAFAIAPGTYFFKEGRRYKIAKASYQDGTFMIERVIPEGGREVEYHG